MCGKTYYGSSHTCISSGSNWFSPNAMPPIEHRGITERGCLHYYEDPFWHESLGFCQKCKLCGSIRKI